MSETMRTSVIAIASMAVTAVTVYVFASACRPRKRTKLRGPSVLSLAVLLCVSLANAQEHAQSRKMRLLKISQAVLCAGNALDAASSWGQPELTPWMASGGLFGGRGLAIKVSIPVSVIVGELRLVRQQPAAITPITWGNFVAGGITTGIAVRNWSIR